MNRKVTLVLIASVLIAGLSAFTVVLHKTGEIFYTGSPFDGQTCAACHSGGATIPTVTVTGSPAFTGGTYSPSTTYTVSVTVSGSYSKFGFDIEMLDSNSPSAALDAGTFGAMLSGNCQKFVFAGNPTNVTHTTPSGTGGNATFSYVWTSPASGSVFIYCTGIGANNNNSNSGDRVGSFSTVLTPAGIGVSEYAAQASKFEVFPNPASERVMLSYELTERSLVSVALFTLSGEKVGELMSEVKQAGAHSSELRLPVMAKGAYLVKLSLNGKETLQKLFVN